MFPPLSASFCSTVLCSHMFICAESPILSDGHPSSTASSLVTPFLLRHRTAMARTRISTQRSRRPSTMDTAGHPT